MPLKLLENQSTDFRAAQAMVEVGESWDCWPAPSAQLDYIDDQNAQ